MNTISKTNFYLNTPLIRSYELSRQSGTNIYFKLEALQPTDTLWSKLGSFKIRGISNLIKKKVEQGATQIVASSGGNAGMAAAYTARMLNLKATILVPQTTTKMIIDRLESYGACVRVHGSVWDETDKEARRLVNELENAAYIPPFDDKFIWEGNSTIIDEIKEQLNNVMPDCVIASVGGGGLMLGLIEGAIRHDWMSKDFKLIAVETEGANCFAESIKHNELITLDAITSIAKTLGAKTCSQKLFDYYKQYKDKIESIVLPDHDSVLGCLNFLTIKLDDQRVLVEPSCGVSVQIVYDLKKYLNDRKFENIVVIVCGGSGVSLETLNKLKTDFQL